MTNDQPHFNNGKEDSEADFKMEFLKRHNQLRKLHSSPDLRLSEELCFMAEEWANKISTKGHISFAEISGIGENITAFPTGKTAREMVDYWYKENRKYEYETPGWQAGTNYFTQIVWKATEELGVGCVRMHRIKVPDNKQQKEESRDDYNEEKQQQIMVVVAFYRPAGNSNRSGQFSHNVSKPFSDIVNGE